MKSSSGNVKTVKSAIRTMDLFTMFAEQRRPLTLGEVASGMQAPKSSTYELIQTLVQMGFLLVLEGGKVYYPSRRLWEISELIAQFSPLKQKIDHLLRELREVTGETVVVGRLRNSRVFYSTVLDGTHAIRYSANSGDIHDVHVSAMGKGLLSLMEPGELNRCLRELTLKAHTPSTITNQKSLRDNVLEQAQGGVFIAIEEQQPEVMELATALVVQGHHLAIGLIGPEFRLQKNIARYSQVLTEITRKILA